MIGGNTGHGHVWARPDGMKARCGGPGICAECSRDKAQFEKQRSALDRDALGMCVREAWMRWAMEQPRPKPSWLVPWDHLSEPDKEADRRIGEAVVDWWREDQEARAETSSGGITLAEDIRAMVNWCQEQEDLYNSLAAASRDENHQGPFIQRQAYGRAFAVCRSKLISLLEISR